MLHRTLHGAFVLFLLYRLPLVILFLASCQGDVHLGASMLVDEDQQRHYGQSRVLALLLKLMDFTLGKQELAVAARWMVRERAVEIRADIHALHPHLALVDIAEGVDKRCLAGPYRLYLRATQDHSCGIGVEECVEERCFLVPYLHRTLLSYFFFFLVHIERIAMPALAGRLLTVIKFIRLSGQSYPDGHQYTRLSALSSALH